MIDIFVLQVWNVLIILLIFIILTIWFLPAGTTFGYLLGLFVGAAVVSLITWFTMKFASRSLSRILINATEFKEEAYILMFNCGFGVIMLAVACVYFFFVIVFLLLKGMYLSSHIMK
jgi:Na+/H+-translocating membrane pyrophosphatase